MYRDRNLEKKIERKEPLNREEQISSTTHHPSNRTNASKFQKEDV